MIVHVNESEMERVMNENESCRFCFENYLESKEIIFHPCVCKQGIHQTCLLKWLFRADLHFTSAQYLESTNLSCTICNTKYKIETKIIWKYNSFKAWGFLICFVSFLILLYKQFDFFSQNIDFVSLNFTDFTNYYTFLLIYLIFVIINTFVLNYTYLKNELIGFFPQLPLLSLLDFQIVAVLGILFWLYLNKCKFILLTILTDIFIFLSCLHIIFVHVIKKEIHILRIHSFFMNTK